MKKFKDYKDYFEFETEMLEESKENLIQRIWFAFKQRDEANKRANESVMMFADKDTAFEDRKLFVRNLGKLLSQTREDVESCELGEDEIVTVYFLGGGKKKINVNMDSYSAIIKDVTKYCG